MLRLTLVGYRASGKTTVGARLARLLDRPFIDADVAIAGALGQPIAAFFAAHGEAAFRDREAQTLTAILAGDAALVLATGGGAVLRGDNRRLLRERGGLVVYCHAPAAVLQARLRADSGGRPSLTGADVADEVPTLLAQRDPLYRQVADAVVDADRPIETVADAILALVSERAG